MALCYLNNQKIRAPGVRRGKPLGKGEIIFSPKIKSFKQLGDEYSVIGAVFHCLIPVHAGATDGATPFTGPVG